MNWQVLQFRMKPETYTLHNIMTCLYTDIFITKCVLQVNWETEAPEGPLLEDLKVSQELPDSLVSTAWPLRC